jgi:hypothetical protein
MSRSDRQTMLTIAWDIDDVLNNLMYTWLEEWWKPSNTDCNLDFEDLTENPPHRLLKIKKSDYLKSLDAYRLSGNYAKLQPDKNVLNWFKKYGPNYRHMALTAVPRIAASISASWVLEHFGDWIRTFHFVPSPRPEDIPTSNESTKGAYLEWLNRADIFIDDHEGNIKDVKSGKIQCVTVSRPWNSNRTSINEILEGLSLYENIG